MRRIFGLSALITTAALATVALAQVVVDESSSRLPQDEVRIVLRVVSSQLRDAGSAQIGGLRRVDAANYCGQVNAKTVRGGYAGFRPFVVSLVPPAFVVFQGPGNEGQFEAGATIFPMPERGNGCGAW